MSFDLFINFNGDCREAATMGEKAARKQFI